MRVAILGAGAIARASLACLGRHGHGGVLWSPSGGSAAAFAAGEPLVSTGALAGHFPADVAGSCGEAIAGADAVLLALPANGHRSALEAAAPHIRDGQTVIISAHLSFAALYLSRLLSARGVRATVVAWSTTVATGRRTGPNGVHMGTVRQQVEMAVLPAGKLADAHALCTRLFGERFVPRDNLLAIALGNINPQNHLAIALLNLTRMELGENWSQPGHVTPAVGRLIEDLDAERLAIGLAFGLQLSPVQQHIARSYQLPPGSVAAMNLHRHQQGLGVAGPRTLDSRYVLEDAPFGLLPTVQLGRLAGRPARLHAAGLALLCAAYGRDFEQENDLLPMLGLQDLPMDELQRRVRAGF